MKIIATLLLVNIGEKYYYISHDIGAYDKRNDIMSILMASQ